MSLQEQAMVPHCVSITGHGWFCIRHRCKTIELRRLRAVSGRDENSLLLLFGITLSVRNSVLEDELDIAEDFTTS